MRDTVRHPATLLFVMSRPLYILSVHSFLREGRAICQLVSLASPVTDLVAEYDCRLELRADNEQSADDIQATNE